MHQKIAVVGAGVSGLTSGVILAERRYHVSIFAREIGQGTTSAVAAAVWFPYDAEPADKVIPWALETYNALLDLTDDPASGVSMIELRQFSRTSEIQIPDWAIPLGAHVIPSAPSVMSSEVACQAVALREGLETSLTVLPSGFQSGFSLRVPLIDTTIYLDYLAKRFSKAGGEINANVRFDKFEDVPGKFDLVVNCAGIGARELAHDVDLEPHRGQVAIVPRIDNLSCAIVCDDPPLMYAIPRTNDCVFGGTNEISDDLDVDPESTARIVGECSRVLKIEKPKVIAERVGLRPFRRSGVRLERDRLRDDRTIIHNYGHGGAGFTLSWGCAEEVLGIADSSG